MRYIINRIVISYILLFTCSIAATEGYSTYVINVGIVTGGWGPFQQWDGKKASGFSVELMKIFAKKLGYKISWHAYPDWESMYVDACRGKVDVLLDAFNTETRQCVTYSKPYFTSPTVVVVRQDSKLFRDVSRLQTSRIAIEKGFLTEKLIKFYYPNVKQHLFVDTHSALLALEQGLVDAYIGNFHVVKQFAQNHPSLVVVAQLPLLIETLHLGVTSDKHTLLTQLDTAIEALSVEDKAKLEKSWFQDSITPNYLTQSSFLLRPDERKWLETLPPIKLGLTPNWEPFSYRIKNSPMTGLIVDYLTILKEKLGLAYQDVRERDRTQLQQQLLHHEIDMTVLPVRTIKQLVGWHGSVPFISFPLILVTQSGNLTISDITDLAGKNLILTDSMLIPQLKELVPDLKVTISNNTNEGLSRVAAGEGDAYIGNLVVTSHIISKKFDGILKIAAPTPFRDELAVAVREPYKPLLPLINRVFYSMNDRDKRQIRNSWLALNYNEGISWQILLRTLVPLGTCVILIIITILIAYLRLRKEIVHRKQVEKALATAKVKAELAAIQKGEFLATMSHEIRTPMNGIIGMAEQLTFTNLTQDQHQMVEIINRGALGLHMLINNVLDYAKLEADKMQLEKAPFLIHELIDDVLNMTVSDINNKKLRIYLWADVGVAARVNGDALRLRQILFNFISNAIKFTERGFIEISLQLLAQEGEQQQLQFGVRDSGIGMSPEVLNRIFNAFEQADSSTTRNYGGSGLGLTICQTLARLMGGEIKLESALGLGTFITLTVTLPVLAQREPDPRFNNIKAFIEFQDEKLCHTLMFHLTALGIERTKYPNEAKLHFSDNTLTPSESISVQPLIPPLGYRYEEGGYLLNSNPMTWNAVREVCYRQLSWGDEQMSSSQHEIIVNNSILPYKILLVEDNPLNQKLVVRQLQQLALKCDLAEHGQQALDMLKLHPYDLVLCDCQMPVIDGYDFTRLVREAETDEHLLIIAMTANVLPEQISRCYSAGMDDLLSKPVLLDDLRQMLKKWHILPSERLLDLALMRDLFGGGEQLSLILRQFAHELEQALVQQPTNDEELADWVHRQAGTLSMMMIPGMAEQAWQLEISIRQQGAKACINELTSFRQVLIQLLEDTGVNKLSK